MIPHPTLLKNASFPTVLDSSILLTASCPTKFFYQYCLSLAPVSKSIHLHAGGAFAHAVETVRKAFYLEGKSLDISLFDGWRAFTTYWGDYDEVPTEGSGSYKDFINMSAALFDYFRQYNPETDYIQPFVKANGEPAVEFTFSIPLPIMHPDSGDPLIYAGRCDMIGQYQGNVCIVDEKTSYMFAQDWSKNFSMRGQFLGYTFAARHFGIPANMCIVRGIAIQQRSIKHLEAILTFPQWQLDRWFENMLFKVQSLVDAWNAKSFNLNLGNECASYGGCPMIDLCQSKNPENWVETFEIRKWNPLDVGHVKEATAG